LTAASTTARSIGTGEVHLMSPPTIEWRDGSNIKRRDPAYRLAPAAAHEEGWRYG